MSERGERDGDAAASDQFLDETVEFWQPYTDRMLTREDARQIRENLTGFFGLLRRWQADNDGRTTPKPEAANGTTEQAA